MQSNGAGRSRSLPPPMRGRWLWSFVEDSLDLAAIEVDFASDGPLAATGLVPCPYCLFQAWRFGQCGVVRRGRLLAPPASKARRSARLSRGARSWLASSAARMNRLVGVDGQSG